jgi:hypothetical protein
MSKAESTTLISKGWGIKVVVVIYALLVCRAMTLPSVRKLSK